MNTPRNEVIASTESSVLGEPVTIEIVGGANHETAAVMLQAVNGWLAHEESLHSRAAPAERNSLRLAVLRQASELLSLARLHHRIRGSFALAPA